MSYHTTTSTVNFFLRLTPSESFLKKFTVSMTIFVILPLLGFYLFQVGDLIKASFLVKNYRTEIEKLSEQNMVLQAESTEFLSLETIEGKIEDLGFVKVAEVKYIPIPYHYLTRKTR